MNPLQSFSDKTAVTLSVLCTLHCLALPLLLAVTPSLAAMPMAGEAFHMWMVIAVVPVSLYALTVGCKQHKRRQLLVLGAAGITCLLVALSMEAVAANFGLKESVAEVTEKVLTVLGATLVALGHIRNYQLCQQAKPCHCPE